MNEMTALLKQQPFLAGLAPHHIKLLAACAAEVTFEPRELVFREGELASAFYLIQDGKIALEIFSPQRGPVTVETVRDGEVLGWSWLVEPYTWHFDAQALKPTRALMFDASKLRRAFQGDVGFGFALLNRFVPIIVDRLEATRVQLLDLYHVHA